MNLRVKMWDKKIIAISDRQAVKGDFLDFVARLGRAKVDALILREKDMRENDYYDLAKEVLKICKKHKLVCFLHNFDKVALKLNHRYFHCPLDILRAEPRVVRYFHLIGTSVHSSNELLEAMEFNCHYALFGHIFETLAKPLLPPRGLDMLSQICEQSTIPIYAVGGIKAENIALLKGAGVAGACMKGVLTKQTSLKSYIKRCALALNE